MNIIDIIDEKVSLRTLLENYGVVFKGNRFACPIHDGRNLNCVLTDRPYFHCFKCNGNWNAISFVRHKENCDTKKAIDILDDMFTLGLNKTADREVIKKHQIIKEQRYDVEKADREEARKFLECFENELPLTEDEQDKFISDWISEAKTKRLVEAVKPIDENREHRHKIIVELRKIELLLDEFDLSNPQEWSNNRTDNFMALKKKQTELDEMYWKLC